MSDVKVTILKNGPLKLEGPLQLVQDSSATTPAGPMFLCRCGASAKKPFCDGAHTRIGFQDDAVSGVA